MISSLLRRMALTLGAALVLIGLALPASGGPAMAQGLPPRPTVTPPRPTAAPGGDRDSRKPAAPGRITGTVIDTRTGAPAPGTPVRVGETLVQSDANGNYDLNGLAPGSYTVALELAAGRGEPAQAPLTVALAAGQTVVQHLFFRSPAPAAVTPEPAPVSPSPPEAPFAAAPASLPPTSGRAGGQAPLIACGAALIAAGLGLRRRR